MKFYAYRIADGGFEKVISDNELTAWLKKSPREVEKYAFFSEPADGILGELFFIIRKKRPVGGSDKIS